MGKRQVQELARTLHLDPRAGETTAALFARCLRRAKALAQLMQTDEASDPERDRWPWTEDD